MFILNGLGCVIHTVGSVLAWDEITQPSKCPTDEYRVSDHTPIALDWIRRGWWTALLCLTCYSHYRPLVCRFHSKRARQHTHQLSDETFTWDHTLTPGSSWELHIKGLLSSDEVGCVICIPSSLAQWGKHATQLSPYEWMMWIWPHPKKTWDWILRAWWTALLCLHAFHITNPLLAGSTARWEATTNTAPSFLLDLPHV